MPQKQHKALFLESKYGEFKVKDRDTPKPGPGELLVRNEAVALNPVEWKIQTYGISIEDYPAILGYDIAGMVEEIGEGVSGYLKGDRVFFQGSVPPDRAGFQQYTIAVAEFTAKIPPNLSFDEAASVPSGLASAVIGLYTPKPHGPGNTPPFDTSARGIYAKKPLVVLGGSASVGQNVIQLAKLSGFSPIITTASSGNEVYLKSLGATHIIDRTIPLSNLSNEITKITTAPIELVYDAVASEETQQTGYDILADGGHLVMILSQKFKASSAKKTTFNFFGSWSDPQRRELGVALHGVLTGLLEQGLIKPNRVEVLPGGLNGVQLGLDKLKANQVSGGKLLIRPQETV
ncbi:Enoyl reductase LovC [Hypsizygus marmoreus]|uniref:Enoyl reductase LovC n=1 Tax=Hypsizygus marmoreus TaxID=39966 RepID=A0A369K4S2_HYPMA|nr:Enoyl reductase LovC [Hypsizygus marmoreus]